MAGPDGGSPVAVTVGTRHAIDTDGVHQVVDLHFPELDGPVLLTRAVAHSLGRVLVGLDDADWTPP